MEEMGELPLGEVVQVLRRVVDRAQESCADVDTPELMGQVAVLQELICAASAAQVVAIGQFAAREDDYDDDGMLVSMDRGIGYASEFAGDELAPVLGMAPVTAATRARQCVKLCTDLPVTLRALAEGRLDAFRAQVIAEELELADADVCALVEGKIHPRVTGETPGRVRSRVRRALEEVDPLAVRARAIKARADRFVRMCAGDHPGMTSWWASLPAAESLACWAAIDQVAHQMKTEDPTRTLEQCRADALLDLILARTEVSTTINIAVPVHTATPAGTGESFFSSSDSASAEQDDCCPPPGFGFATAAHVPGLGVIPPRRDQRAARPVRHPSRSDAHRRHHRHHHRDQQRLLPAPRSHPPVRPSQRRHLPFPRLRSPSPTLRPGPHRFLAPRADHPSQPDLPMPTPPPPQDPHPVETRPAH